MLEIFNGIKTNIIVWFQGLTPWDYASVLLVLLKIIAILIVVKVIMKFGTILISGLFDRQTKPPFRMETRKAETLKALFQSILRYVVYFVAAMMILGEFVDTASLLATAGIAGLAIGFGAQSLVKDVITGFFILFEDQYSVGDFVTVGEFTGTVEEVGLRITMIRGFRGELNIIPNGQVISVVNHTRGSALAVVDMPVSYEADISKAIRIMDETAQAYAEGNQDIAEAPQVLGITSVQPSDVTIRLIARTLPNKQWGVERELRKKIKETFDKNDLTSPYQHMVVMIKQDKQDG